MTKQIEIKPLLCKGGFLVLLFGSLKKVKHWWKLNESNVLEEVQERLIHQATKEGFIMDDTVAIDATHFEALDRAPSEEKNQKENAKNVGVSPRLNVNSG